jgi:hypothetical protein
MDALAIENNRFNVVFLGNDGGIFIDVGTDTGSIHGTHGKS